ncbi:MAG: arsenic resistance protein [Thermoproteota archaeon]|nr:arsenic resistance protein [Thermoproteota archaeon]
MVEVATANKSFFLISATVLSSVSGGILLPEIGINVEPYILLWLGLLLFFNLLRLDTSKLLLAFTKPGNLAMLSIVKLVVIPLTVYAVMDYVFYPPISTDTMLSIFLLSGISTGLGSPFVVNFVQAKLPMVVGLIITTSLAVPFVLPAMVFVLFQSHFLIPIYDMILLLSFALITPLLASHFIKKYAPAITTTMERHSLTLSYAFIFLLNFGVFAKYSHFFFLSPSFVMENVLIAFALYGTYGFTGYFFALLLGMDKQERMSIFIAMTYVNNMLVVVFAQQFFGEHVAALAAFFNIPYYCGIVILGITFSRLFRVNRKAV